MTSINLAPATNLTTTITLANFLDGGGFRHMEVINYLRGEGFEGAEIIRIMNRVHRFRRARAKAKRAS